MNSSELNLDVPASGAVFSFGKLAPQKFHIKNDAVVSAACGEGHALLCTASGRVFAFGQNDYGQLGLGHRQSSARPACIKKLKELRAVVTKVACGATHSLLLADDGRIFGCGANADGQLLLDSEEDCDSPEELRQLRRHGIADLAAGRHFSLALTRRGELLAWGSNAEGCLGQDDPELEVCTEPLPVPLPDRVVTASAGSYHAACVLSNGQLFAWGETEGGKLGLGSSVQEAVAMTPKQVPLPNRAKAVAVACGQQHTLVLTDSGSVLACGSNDSGQLGLGSKVAQCDRLRQVAKLEGLRITCVAAGAEHSLCCSSSSGQALAFGSDRHGRLGPTSAKASAPASLSSSFNGGDGCRREPQPLAALRSLRVTRAACGAVLTVLLAEPRPDGDADGEGNLNGDGDDSEEDDGGGGSRRGGGLSARRRGGGSGFLSGRQRRRRSSGGDAELTATANGDAPGRIVRDLEPIVRPPNRLEPLRRQDPHELSRRKHVMAVTKFDSMLAPTGDVSPDTQSDNESTDAAHAAGRRRRTSQQKQQQQQQQRQQRPHSPSSPPLPAAASRDRRRLLRRRSLSPPPQSPPQSPDGRRGRKSSPPSSSRRDFGRGRRRGDDDEEDEEEEDKDKDEARSAGRRRSDFGADGDGEGNGEAVGGVGCGRSRRQRRNAGGGDGGGDGGKSRSCVLL